MDHSKRLISDQRSDIMTNRTDLDPWEWLYYTGQLRSLGDGGYLATGIYLAIVGTIATIGNGLVCFVIIRSKKLRKRPHNMLLVNMAFSDLCITFFGYPYTTISSFCHRYIFGWVYCILQGFTTFLFALSSMNTLAVISIYRYVAVCLPQHKHKLTIRATHWVLVATWFYTVLWTAPPLFGWSRYTIEPFGTSCSMDWTSPMLGDVLYDYGLIVFCYLLHIGIMSYCYYKIVKKSSELSFHRKRKVMDVEDAKSQHKLKVEVKVTRMCLVMVVIFIAVWSPYAFVCLWSIYDPGLPIWLTTLPTMFAKLASMLNPFIYAATNNGFKETAKNILLRRNRKINPTESFRLRRQKTMNNIYTVDRTKEGVYIGLTDVKVPARDSTFF